MDQSLVEKLIHNNNGIFIKSSSNDALQMFTDRSWPHSIVKSDKLECNIIDNYMNNNRFCMIHYPLKHVLSRTQAKINFHWLICQMTD